MDLQKGNIRTIYFKFLFPCLFSGLITSIYSLVDMIVVGQYEGANGTAALACIAPFWTFFCCLSVLFGSGGAVLFSTAKGKGDRQESNEAFTVALVLICSVAAVIWLIIFLFHEPLLRLCGADDILMPLAKRYMGWLKWGVPLFPIGYFLGMFVRNDGSPTLAGAAIICGGVFNIFADIFLTFTCDLGIEGAAIATVAGQAIAFCILMTHFFSKKNTMSLIKITAFYQHFQAIVSIGLSSFLIDIGMGVMVILFNNQIRHYFGNNELAVYGVAGNLFALIQTFSYGIGNAAQPILAENLGAGNLERVDQTRKMGTYTAVVIGTMVGIGTILFPAQIVRAYINASPEVLSIAPYILRRYFLCFLFVPVNVFTTFYLQAIQRVRESIGLSVLRGFLLCGVFLYIFPPLFGADALWSVMFIAELATVLIAVVVSRKIK